MNIDEIIKERYKELPADIKEAIANTDLASKFDAIAKKHGLHIDQNGSLQTETILVMIGLESTEDYVDNIKKALDISRVQAIEIAKDINSEILDSIRVSIRQIQEREEGIENTETINNQVEINNKKTFPPATETINHEDSKKMISSIEKAGDFTVEEHHQSSSPQYSETNIDRDKLLKHIENDHIPLVDHLLTTPTNNSAPIEMPTEIKKEDTKTETQPSKGYQVDPYREQM